MSDSLGYWLGLLMSFIATEAPQRDTAGCCMPRKGWPLEGCVADECFAAT